MTNEPLEYCGKPVKSMSAEERADLLAMMKNARSLPGGYTCTELEILRLEVTIRESQKALIDLAKRVSSLFATKIPLEMGIRDICHRLFLGKGVPEESCCRCKGHGWMAQLAELCGCDCHGSEPPDSKTKDRHPLCDECLRLSNSLISAHPPLCDCNCHRGGELPL